jgi:hypothetical protein
MTPHHTLSYPIQSSNESHQDSSPPIQPFPRPPYPDSLPILLYHQQAELPFFSPFIPGSLWPPPDPYVDYTLSFPDFVPKDSNMGIIVAIYSLLRQQFSHPAVDGLDFGNFLQLLNTHPNLNTQVKDLINSGSSPGILALSNPQTNPSLEFYVEQKPQYFPFEDHF